MEKERETLELGPRAKKFLNECLKCEAREVSEHTQRQRVIFFHFCWALFTGIAIGIYNRDTGQFTYEFSKFLDQDCDEAYFRFLDRLYNREEAREEAKE